MADDVKCTCGRTVVFGPEVIPDEDVKRLDLAIRCVYCLYVFCVPCSKKHFEARNGGKVQKRVTTQTTTTEEWLETPASAWAQETK